jgi:hypothetical protein
MERLPMRKIREILRLRHEKGLSQRAVAAACGMGAGTVSEYLSRAAQAGVHWPLPLDLDDSVLEARLFPRAQTSVCWSTDWPRICWGLM